jgi:hypothetical protein
LGPGFQADREAVDEQTWTFTRSGQQLEICRVPTDGGMLLRIVGDGAPRTTEFTDLDRLESFQRDFEKFLLATGWTFASFTPERRLGHERRHFSRLLSDRRRWWTDGTKTDSEHDRSAGRRDERRRGRKSRDLVPR